MSLVRHILVIGLLLGLCACGQRPSTPSASAPPTSSVDESTVTGNPIEADEMAPNPGWSSTNTSTGITYMLGHGGD